MSRENSEQHTTTVMAELEVEVSFTVRTWEEPRPYGEGYAMERMSDVGDFEFRINGEEYTFEELISLFGEEGAQAITADAPENV